MVPVISLAKYLAVKGEITGLFFYTLIFSDFVDIEVENYIKKNVESKRIFVDSLVHLNHLSTGGY